MKRYLMQLLVLSVFTARLISQVDAVRFDTVGWAFVPAVNQSDEIVGFLAWDKSGGAGSNVSIIWYEYDQFSAEFEAFAWNHNDLGAAALWIRDEYGGDAFFVHNELIPESIVNADTSLIVNPKPFTAGLFSDDPLAAAVSSSSDPQPILMLLSSIGYEAAPSISEMQVSSISSGSAQIGIQPVPIDSSCLQAAGSLEAYMLNDLLARAESLIETGQDLPANRNCGWICSCTTTVTVTPTGPWVSGTGTVGTGGQQECRFTRPATRTVTKTGDYWYCLSCAGTTTTTGVQHEECCYPLLPGETCPATPPAGSTPWFFPGPGSSPGYP